MKDRITFEDWSAIITMVAFILCFLAFLYFCWRAIRMSRRHREHMSSLPLETERKEPPENEQ